MRRVVFRSATVLTLSALLLVPLTAFADDDPFTNPGARIQPPIGGTATARIQPPIGFTFSDWLQIVWFAARIVAPIG